ncbi:hypothetical protein CBR_g44416 [Chara braunii]|uniref:Integrase catalytic domain-containing protein n=1 Tax=Chara braunii TaxID=69332 RepID=A0A388LXK8_CHABU|nr:hypothetical protein CBR_g44416 [Chara braunii]|eukprot:GBG86962.1 hypothetical protein CBR_g44416 [Chara braunii]
MDQKSGETAAAYQAWMLALITEAKQRADAAAAAKKKKAEDAKKALLLAIEQQRQHDEAAAKAADEEYNQRHEKPPSAAGATTVAAPVPSTSDRLNALEVDVGVLKDGMQLQQTATQQLEQRICTASTHPSMSQRESTPKFDSQEIFRDATKTNLIPWFRQFELKLQLHHVPDAKHHAYLYSRSGGACQAWLDNLLSKYGVVATDLHTKISWADLKAAWHKRFQIEPPKMKAMDKLIKFHQNTLPSGDWIAEFQRLTSVPGVPMGFQAMKHYFISRLCPTLSMTLTQVADTLTTTVELFDKVAQIIVTNTKAKYLSPATGPSREQHRPNVAVVTAATSTDPSSEVVSTFKGDRLAAARDGGRPGRGRGRGKSKTNTTFPDPRAAAQDPSTHYGLSESVYSELRPLLVPLRRRREAIAMDIIRSFPKHKTSVDGILTVVDRLTKFAMFWPCLYHAKAPELAEVLYAGWIRTKGYPKEIVCDRDTRFMSDFWWALIKRWGSSLKPSSARHPQTDGQTKRAHQTAQVLLRTLIRPEQKDWVERLSDVELAYNSSIHPAMGMSPFEFEHGSPVTSPLDTIIPRVAESNTHLLVLRRMQELLVKACDQMAKTQ